MISEEVVELAKKIGRYTDHYNEEHYDMFINLAYEIREDFRKEFEEIYRGVEQSGSSWAS